MTINQNHFNVVKFNSELGLDISTYTSAHDIGVTSSELWLERMVRGI